MGWAAIYGGYLVGSYIYHRLTDKHPPKPQPAKEIEVPRTDDGAAYPLIYGTCRVRSPILAWAANPVATGAGPWHYKMDFLMVLGIPFEQAQIRLGRVWVDETRLGPVNPQWSKVAGGDYIMDNPASEWATQQGYIGGRLDVFDGNPSQVFVDPVTLVPQNQTAAKMITAGVSAQLIPSYRGFASIGHWGGASSPWEIGDDNVLGTYSYEICSQPPGYPWGSGFNGFTSIDANPVDVIYDLLTGTFGKLKLPTSKIDAVSFQSARVRLWEEQHGYSRAIEDAVDAAEIIREICEQIDAVVYEDPRDGLIKIKLVRDDYAVADLQHITKANCIALDNFAAGGYEGTINKVRVIFANRDDMYRDGSGTAHDLAAAAGQNGEVREILVRMPGVCTQPLANTLAARELAALSRPIAKFRAIVSREFYTVCPGDVLKVTWPEYGISERVFRVGGVDRGSLENGRIALDMIEDFYSVYRQEVIPPIGPSFPGEIATFPLEPAGGGTPWIGGGGTGPEGPPGEDGDDGAQGPPGPAPSGTGFAYVIGGTLQDPAISGTAATALLDVFTSGLKGLVPASGGGTANYLRADGTFAVPSGSVTPSGLTYFLSTGHDGAVTFDGSTTILGLVPSASVYTLTRDIFVSSMTVDSGVTIKTNNFRIFCTGTLTNNGTIANNGNSGSGAGAGAATTVQLYGATSPGGAGSNNSNGAPGGNSGSLPRFPGVVTNSTNLGGAVATAGTNGNVPFRGGGGGGANATRTGGSAGTTQLQGDGVGGPSMQSILRGTPEQSATRWTFGSGGGGGGGLAIGSGGGGGAGGGLCTVTAAMMTGSGAFEAKGGNGGNANTGGGTGAGGGGGGGGGLVYLAYGTRAGSWTTSIVGGTGGTGNSGGGAGGTGADGFAYLLNLSGDGT